MKILIGFDASSHSERALCFVTRMRWPAGSRMIVVSVLASMTGAMATPYEPASVAPELLEEQRRQLHEPVTRAEILLRGAGFATEGRVVDGEPRETLIEVAKREHADLIVVGSQGRTGISKLMLGSVSSHVVTHAPCSVLVVKQAGSR